MSHFYNNRGELITEVPKNGGGTRSVTIKDARKNGWLPSVTTITKTSWEVAPNLMKWKLNTLIDLLREKPQNINLKNEQILNWYYNETGKATSKGSNIHDEITKHLRGEASSIDSELKSWIDENILEVYEIEKTFVNDKYAGTIDLICDLKGYGKTILDWKTQGFEKSPVVYDDHKFQLVAYQQLVDFNATESVDYSLVDVYISTVNDLIIPKPMKHDTVSWASDVWRDMVKYYYTRRKLD